MHRRYVSILWLFICFSNASIAQTTICSTCGPADIGIISRQMAEDYIATYGKIFRDTEDKKKIYSESVEFSRSEMKRFFSRNNSSAYCGFNMYFISGSLSSRLGHKDVNQIGVALVPRKETGFPDFGGYLAENLGFNIQGGHGNRDGIYRPIGRPGLDLGREKYKLKYGVKKDTSHTRYVMVGSGTTSFLRSFVNDPANNKYKTYRFYFISYGMNNPACDRNEAASISLIIIPVDQDGVDYDAFKNYVLASKEFKSRAMVLNHGSLCPNYCPDGDQ